ncbi:arsenical pump-driving ATPase [Stieleria sp. TO1_6]|uniref:arsenical pump-driving ATPase n=1 Tax=Stieleria tagensis TaxID=2956795 RepID=UPI00209AB5E4|nr:arsenical pump-driving ATPase [Stieleria tagensis]MCO8122311.1 arsenical pump-driving ATPase [Stieleria tagensis]
MKFLDTPTRNLFFTGKGGVGKTSMACASAIQLADRGRSVLLVSTDPASNLDEVLGTELSNRPTAVESVPGLMAMNIDPGAAAAEYRERMVGPYRGVLPDAAVASMEEQFSGSCTMEIAAFDEFAKLLGDPETTREFDHVVFDTAPTGHTLRLLTLPSAWSQFVDMNSTGTSCLGPLAGLKDQQLIYKQTVQALADSESTTLILVTRPEPSTLNEAARTSGELLALGVNNQQLIVNAVFQNQTPDDLIAAAMQQRGSDALDGMPATIAQLPRSIIPLATEGLMGVDSLRGLGRQSSEDTVLSGLDSPSTLLEIETENLSDLIDDLAKTGHGVILTMGKGGVGKTTIAAAVAVALAQRGFPVHLSTTDPAAHLAGTLTRAELPGLSIGRIDPAEEAENYKAEVLQSAGSELDAQGKALLEEDLRSPCTEEIAVFRAFAKAVDQGKDGFVVLDTAPTGHTILLLDSALAYHREVTRQTSEIPASVVNLLPRLRDPDFTRILVVTLPEATPVHEAATLQADLRRAEIEPFGWVINQSLLPLEISDPVLQRRRQRELPFIEEVASELASRLALVSWQSDPPTGQQALQQLISTAPSSVPQDA